MVLLLVQAVFSFVPKMGALFFGPKITRKTAVAKKNECPLCFSSVCFQPFVNILESFVTYANSVLKNTGASKRQASNLPL